jgi:hypothetical protein
MIADGSSSFQVVKARLKRIAGKIELANRSRVIRVRKTHPISLTNPDRPMADTFALILYLFGGLLDQRGRRKVNRTTCHIQRIHDILPDLEQFDRFHERRADMTRSVLHGIGAIEMRPFEFVRDKVGCWQGSPANGMICSADELRRDIVLSALTCIRFETLLSRYRGSMRSLGKRSTRIQRCAMFASGISDRSPMNNRPANFFGLGR